MRVTKGFEEVSPTVIKILDFEHNGISSQIFTNVIDLAKNWIPVGTSKIKVKLEIAHELLNKQIQFSTGDICEWTIRSYCKATQIQHWSETVPMSPEKIQTLTIEIPNNEIANDLQIRLALNVSPGPNSSKKLGAPIIPKSRVWEENIKVQLSGDHTRIDVLQCDWSKNDELKNALWRIQISTPEDVEFWRSVEISTAVRVEVNQKFSSEIQSENLHSVALATDMLTEIIRPFFEALKDPEREDSIIEMMTQPDNELDGSWIMLARNVYEAMAPAGLIGVKEMWFNQQSDVRAIIQNYAFRAMID